MTVIAWRGNTIAADRMQCHGDTQAQIEKIHKEPGGVIFAIAGGASAGRLLMDWYREGADPSKWPKCQEHPELWASLIVWEPNTPYPFYYQQFPSKLYTRPNDYFVWGSGREVAIGALYHGATAIEAVEAANHHCAGCGFGVDSFTR